MQDERDERLEPDWEDRLLEMEPDDLEEDEEEDGEEDGEEAEEEEEKKKGEGGIEPATSLHISEGECYRPINNVEKHIL